MAVSTPPLDIPRGQEILTVKLINATSMGPAIISRFMEPAVPGVTQFPSVPSFSFLLEHASGRKLVFDLGIRKDYQNYAPSVANYIPTTKYDLRIKDNVVDILEEGGIGGSEIEAVIWSHWHWDHIGDPSSFPPSTDLVVGPGFKEGMLPGAPANPDSPILESDYTDRNLREISFDGPAVITIGQFKAYDYFGDHSFYLLDSPGHAIGHLCGLARTTVSPPTFVLLGGDVCHHAGIFRPSSYLSVPQSITPHPFHDDSQSQIPFCPGSEFEELQQSRGKSTQEPVYNPTFGHDIPLAIHTIGKLQELDADENIFVIIAHDSSVRDVVDTFPASLNSWKENGWGNASKWGFFRDLKPYWEQKVQD